MNKGVCNVLAVDLKVKKIKKRSKHKSEVMDKVKAQVVTLSASKPNDVLIIKVNFATFIFNWVLNIGSCAHICSNLQVLRKKRLLEKDKMRLQAGNGASVVAVIV
jgi:hypothetical protein